MQSRTSGDGATAAGLPATAINAQLRRIFASQPFARAPRLRRFLEHVVQEALAGRMERLKEYSLGVDVFDRGVDFDSKLDPIVRVDARRLRRALSDYYAGEGAGDAVEIVLATGSYQPAFRARVGGERPTDRVRLAVARFAAAEGDIAAWSLADGLTDELLTALAGLDELQIVAAGRVATLPDAAAVLARRVGADVALTGTVTRRGDSLRIRAALTNAQTGVQTWSGRYDTGLADVTSVTAAEDALAREITAQLAPQLKPAWRGRARPPTHDAQAYELFLRGRHLLLGVDPATLPQAIELLEAAVAHDPGFGEALAALSDAEFLRGFVLLAPPRDALVASRRLALAALAAEPQLPSAHVALGRTAAVLDHDFVAAEASFERARLADPRSTNARLSQAFYVLAPLGQLEAARTQIATLLDQDPYALGLRLSYARVLMFQRQFEAAISQLELILDFRPDFPGALFALAFAYEHAGQLDLARTTHARHVAAVPYPLVTDWAEAAAAVWDGDPAHARTIVQRMGAQAGPLAGTVMADAWLRLGEPDLALDWLEQAVEARMVRTLHLAVDPDYTPLHGRPRFEALLARSGLGSVRNR